jgi:hypothetical protein
LQQLSAGAIDVTRATELLNGVRQDAPPAPAATATRPPARPAGSDARWLRIQVSDLDSGRQRVRVNVPLGLVKLGMRLGGSVSDVVDPHLMDEVWAAMQDPTIEGTLVEVEDVDDNEHVHIYID